MNTINNEERFKSLPIVPTLMREGKEYTTNLGVYEAKRLNFKSDFIRYVPFGKQYVTKGNVKVVKPEQLSKFVSLTLYRKRDDSLKLLIKNTEIISE